MLFLYERLERHISREGRLYFLNRGENTCSSDASLAGPGDAYVRGGLTEGITEIKGLAEDFFRMALALIVLHTNAIITRVYSAIGDRRQDLPWRLCLMPE